MCRTIPLPPSLPDWPIGLSVGEHLHPPRALPQCEDRSSVRKCFPAPRRGALPLPSALDAVRLDYLPQRVEDLNAVVPKGHLQLATPQRDARVSSPQLARHRLSGRGAACRVCFHETCGPLPVRCIGHVPQYLLPVQAGA